MPKPKQDESKEDYVARFMSSEEAKRDYPDEKQRLAVAYSEYKRSKKSIEVESNPFMVKAPISKFWEEEVSVAKAAGKTEKSTQRFIEVTVSGLKEDRDNEMMSQEAIDDMVMQFKSGTIGFFPDHGFHEQSGERNVYSWKQMMGVWVDARQENDHLIAVVRLNKAHPDQDLFWKYINEGMPIGFSIGGKPESEPEYELIENQAEIEVKKDEKTS